MPEEQDEVERALELLRTVVGASGVTRQEIDKRLEGGRGYTSLVLTGGVKLRFDHIVRILEAVHVERRLFFQMLYPPPATRGPGETARSLLEMFDRRWSEEPAGPTEEELEILVESTVRRVLAEDRSSRPGEIGTRRRRKG